MIEICEIYNEDHGEQSQQQVAADISELEHQIFSDPWSSQAVLETMQNPQTLIIEARDASALVGYIIFYYVLDEGEIARIAVSPEYRRRGIGQGMLEKLRQISAEKKIARWLLDVRSSNEGAITFYRGYGFAEDGVRKNFYTNPIEDAILMSNSL